MSNPNIPLEILDAVHAQGHVLEHLLEVIEDIQRQISGKQQKQQEAAAPQALPPAKQEQKKSSPWQQQQGKKGIFELRTDIDTNEYLTLRDEIWNENGKLNKDGFFYWIIQFFLENQNGIGRKQLRK